MNTVEHIVECYFRIYRQCFTMHDVKVKSGNNRQFDLLAVSLLNGAQYHVESSVTHCERWCPTADELFEKFDRKFFGVPPSEMASAPTLLAAETISGKFSAPTKQLDCDRKVFSVFIVAGFFQRRRT